MCIKDCENVFHWSDTGECEQCNRVSVFPELF